MRTLPIAAILAIIALVLALLAMLDLVKDETALGLAVMALALAVLLPGALGLAGTRNTTIDR